MTKDYKRITTTIKKELLERIDEQAEVKGLSRSSAIEDLLTSGLGLNRLKTAVILAGGEGTRLRPLTYEIPKPLIPVKGKPLMEHTLDLLRKYEIKEVIISVGYMAEKIIEHFGDGSKFGIKIEWIVEDKPLGTAGPLRLLRNKAKDTFLLIWTDVLAEVDLFDFMNFHLTHSGVATIALTTVEDTTRYGVAAIKGNRILKFVEKPKKGKEPSNLINSGIAILEPEIFNYLKKTGHSMIEKDIYPRLAGDGRLYGYPFEGQWFDTGTPEAYEEVLKEWKGVR